MSTVINRTDFNLFKNVSNQVEFLFKTVDRKPASFTTAPTIYVIDDRTNTVAFQKVLTPVDVPRGHFRLLLDPSQVANLDVGHFRYVVTAQSLNGDQFLIYSDQNRSIRGFCELLEGPLPNPQQPILIPGGDFQSDAWGEETYMVSNTAHPGAAQRGNHSGQHTIALYTDNWSGKFYVEASLENGAPTSLSDWFTIPESPITLTNHSGVKSIQFTGNYMWLRLYYLPSVGNSGSITKVLLKN